MELKPQELDEAANRTLDYYNQQAEDFFEGTIGHDVSQNIAALLQYIEGELPFTILDAGCGPGRDLKVFREKGHIAVGLEGSTALLKWHDPIVAVMFGCKICLNSNCLRIILMVFLLTPRCFMCPVRHCHVCWENCSTRLNQMVFCSAPILVAIIRRAGIGGDMAYTMI